MENGRVRVTAWSKYAINSPLVMDIITYGMLTLIDALREPAYCPFRTPEI